MCPGLTVANPSPVSADPGGQTWYLTDDTTGLPSGVDYKMFKDSGTGSSDIELEAFWSGTKKVWVADEPAVVTLNMSGDWSFTINIRKFSSGNGIGTQAWVGIIPAGGGDFISKGTAEQTIMFGEPWGEETWTVTASDFTISPGDYLAVKFGSWSPTTYFLGVTGSPDSMSFATSPSGADEYPGLIIPPGDANEDGVLNATDITEIELIVAGAAGHPVTAGADANEDEVVNALDITKTELLVAI